MALYTWSTQGKNALSLFCSHIFTPDQELLIEDAWQEGLKAFGSDDQRDTLNKLLNEIKAAHDNGTTIDFCSHNIHTRSLKIITDAWQEGLKSFGSDEQCDKLNTLLNEIKAAHDIQHLKNV